MERVFKPQYTRSFWKVNLPAILITCFFIILVILRPTADNIFFGFLLLILAPFTGYLPLRRFKRIVFSDNIRFEFYLKKSIVQPFSDPIRVQGSFLHFERCTMNLASYKNCDELVDIVNSYISNGTLHVSETVETKEGATMWTKILFGAFICLLLLGILACVCDAILYDSIPFHIVGQVSDPLIFMVSFDILAVLVLCVAFVLKKRNQVNAGKVK